MLTFSKMHALGNDFVVIDNHKGNIKLSATTIRAMADRHQGIGFDQLLMVCPPPNDTSDFGYAIFNCDGSEVGQCGNGARCLADFIYRENLSNKACLRLTTKTTSMKVTPLDNHQYAVVLPPAKLSPENIPLVTTQTTPPYALSGIHTKIYTANVGNPHAIIPCENVSNCPFDSLGEAISTHPYFPEQCNVSFMEITDPSHIKIRIYERHVGETMACGSAANACATIARLFFNTDHDMEIFMPGGSLSVHCKNADSPLIQTGPSTFVFSGQWPNTTPNQS